MQKRKQDTFELWFKTFGIEWTEAESCGGVRTEGRRDKPGTGAKKKAGPSGSPADPSPTHLSHLEWPWQRWAASSQRLWGWCPSPGPSAFQPGSEPWCPKGSHRRAACGTRICPPTTEVRVTRDACWAIGRGRLILQSRLSIPTPIMKLFFWLWGQLHDVESQWFLAWPLTKLETR